MTTSTQSGTDRRPGGEGEIGMDTRLLWPLVGMAFGVALGFAGAFGGFGPFFIVLLLGALGFLVGRAIEGDLDIARLLSSNRRSR